MIPGMKWARILTLLCRRALGRSHKRPQSPGTSHAGNQASQAETALQTIVPPSERVGPFPFLKLPPEIRNKIYLLHLFDLDYAGKCDWPSFPVLRQPSITRVNRQIRRETISTFYADNYLVLEVPTPGGSPELSQVHEEQRWNWFIRSVKLFAASGRPSMVRHLTIEYITDESPKFMGIDPMPRLTVELFHRDPRTPDFEELLRRRGVQEDGITYLRFVLGHRIGDDDTDWGDVNAIDEELTYATDRLAGRIQAGWNSSDAVRVRTMPIGGLVEALYALCRKSGSSKRYMFLSAFGHVLC